MTDTEPLLSYAMYIARERELATLKLPSDEAGAISRFEAAVARAAAAQAPAVPSEPDTMMVGGRRAGLATIRAALLAAQVVPNELRDAAKAVIAAYTLKFGETWSVSQHPRPFDNEIRALHKALATAQAPAWEAPLSADSGMAEALEAMGTAPAVPRDYPSWWDHNRPTQPEAPAAREPVAPIPVTAEALAKWCTGEYTKFRTDTGEPEQWLDVSMERLECALAALAPPLAAPTPVTDEQIERQHRVYLDQDERRLTGLSAFRGIWRHAEQFLSTAKGST